MRYRAVVFDFFGTLTVPSSPQRRIASNTEIATVIGAPAEEFRALWWQTWPERCTGAMGDFTTAVREIAARLGIEVSEATLAEAAGARRLSERGFRELRDDALTTLQTLRDWGVDTALISDCTEELSDEWSGSPVAPYIQVPVFSCTAGIKKPDPRIYALAYDALGHAPADCLYVGDGGSHELPGATAVGMSAVRILDGDGEHHRFEPVDWPGPHITTLAEVCDLVTGTA
ncbi:MAG: HAD family hydrolase [Actinomadura sp.]